MTTATSRGFETMSMSTTTATRTEPGATWRPLGRLGSTAYSVGYLFLTIPALALFILETVFIPLTIITVGLLALTVIVPMVAGLAHVHRTMASRIFGEPVLSFYKPTEGLGFL